VPANTKNDLYAVHGVVNLQAVAYNCTVIVNVKVVSGVIATWVDPWERNVIRLPGNVSVDQESQGLTAISTYQHIACKPCYSFIAS